jgi:hypothetical protein
VLRSLGCDGMLGAFRRIDVFAHPIGRRSSAVAKI